MLRMAWSSWGGGVFGLLPQGLDNVIARSMQGQTAQNRLKMAYFCCFCSNYMFTWYVYIMVYMKVAIPVQTCPRTPPRDYRGNIRVEWIIPHQFTPMSEMAEIAQMTQYLIVSF